MEIMSTEPWGDTGNVFIMWATYAVGIRTDQVLAGLGRVASVSPLV